MAVVEILLEEGIATFDKKIIGKEKGGTLVPTLYPFKEHDEVIAVGQNYTLTARIRKSATYEGAKSFNFPIYLRGMTFNKNLSEKNPYFPKILVYLLEFPYFLNEGGRIEELGKAFARTLGYTIEKKKGFYLIKKGRKTVYTVPEKEILEYKEQVKWLLENIKVDEKTIEKINEELKENALKIQEAKVNVKEVKEDLKKVKLLDEEKVKAISERTKGRQDRKNLFGKFLK